MKKLWSVYVDVIIIDSTFNLANNNYSFFAILPINSNAFTEMLTYFFVYDERPCILEKFYN